MASTCSYKNKKLELYEEEVKNKTNDRIKGGI
jgi:hypothetical protein